MIRRAAAAWLILAASAALASVETGAAKWRTGDWTGAVAEWTAPAARGDPDALFNLAQAYRLGRGVPQSTATAIDYYRRAADKGHVAATTNLGITLYQEGRKTEALGQLRTAADRGDLRAAYVLGVATFGGDGAPRNPALGYAYVVRARDGGLAIASGQAARMATRMSDEDRARGEAAAQALASGRSADVVLAQMTPSATIPAPVQPDTSLPDETEDAAEDAKPSKRATGRGKQVADAPFEADQPKPPRPKPDKPALAKAPPDKTRTSDAPKADKAETSDDAAAEGWKVQLGAYANRQAARTAWATLVSQSASLLKGQSPVYAPKGELVRLQVGPFEERADAASLCTKLAAAGRPCFITR